MKCLVAIPVYNEEKHLRDILQRTRKLGHDILVVDDGSTDESPRVAASFDGVHVIRHRENLGYGMSLIDALVAARSARYDCLITLDADQQHEPERIPDFLVHVPEYDIVSGSRYMQPCRGDNCPPEDRRSTNEEITKLINEVTGYDLTDAFCGFKAYSRRAIERLEPTVAGYGMPLQVWIQAARRGLKIKEIPVRLIYLGKTRHFGSFLDEPPVRLSYYKSIIDQERASPEEPPRAIGPRSDGRHE